MIASFLYPRSEKMINRVILGALLLLISLNIYSDETKYDVTNNGVLLDGKNYSLISLNTSTGYKAQEFDLDFYLTLNYGIRVNPNLRFTYLMPGVLWEPYNRSNSEKLYLGLFTGLFSYSFTIVNGEYNNHFTLGAHGKIAYRLGAPFRLSLNLPFKTYFSTEEWGAYNGLYKYNSLNPDIQLEWFINKRFSLSLISGFTYNYTYVEEYDMDTEMALTNKVTLNIFNYNFITIGTYTTPDMDRDNLRIFMEVSRRI